MMSDEAFARCSCNVQRIALTGAMKT